MGTVNRLARPATPTAAEASTAYLGILDHPESVGTRRVYASTLRQLADDRIEQSRLAPHAGLLVEHWSRTALRRAAEQMAQQFRRETRYDFTPYSAEDPAGQLVILLPSHRFLVGRGKLIAGAVGIDPSVQYRDERTPGHARLGCTSTPTSEDLV
ncbi:hypothetical protein [Actinoplanes derwentensis]|uniref:Uncharacterized protein n=1 Tax=Actinoplanes derwentensis TaxID=113562 RepID=A0A1H1XQA7_9ACTN|nr:hypothetical protein [Actinoplanes derwentensis]GID89222.1 hypothetical protein Ade03nite_81460 [Actinoplanes derwentensis]SDT11434.1 hypothetical protein SAMN04489716_2549 [Actinoplanes derwentensis]